MTDYLAAPAGASKIKGFKCWRQNAEEGDVIGFRKKLRARSGGETGQPDRCVYASVSQERRNLPELGRARSGFLYPLRCYYPRKESSEVKSRHNITIENRTRSAAGTAQRDRIPNLNPIGGRISTTQSNHTKIDRVSQPRKNWKRAMPPGKPGGTTMEQSQATRKSGRNDN